MASSVSHSLAGKVAIITGASSGIGAAIGHALVLAGCSVVLAARRVDRLEAEKSSLEAIITKNALPGKVSVSKLDVTCAADWESTISQAIEAHGHIDILINNAGVMLLSKIEKLKVDEWFSMVDINIKGVMLGTSQVLPVFQKQRSGHIVNISSDADRKVFTGSAVYSATKAAVTRFSEGVRMELAQDGYPIRISSVSPGATLSELSSHITDQDILNGFAGSKFEMLQAADVADLVVFIISREGRVNIENVYVRPQEQFF